MSKLNRILVAEVLDGDIMYALDGLTIESATSKLSELKKIYEERGYTNIRIVVDYSYESTYLQLKGDREETEKEYQKRAEKLNRQKALEALKATQKEKDELATYERLKKKYG